MTINLWQQTSALKKKKKFWLSEWMNDATNEKSSHKMHYIQEAYIV